ncbi:UNVERIFIED_CONTAM: hypothetical protein GTU68_024383 [Idotea baltica]|nr:hypothetical protein [Idotea baltica]
MNEAGFKRLVSGGTTGPFANVARASLWSLSLGYRVAAATRNLLFDAGIKQQHSVSAPVISIGNLTTGGTGKTPVVASVVNHLVAAGRKPAIISRGYRAIDGEANDEKMMLDQLCPNVVHLQNPDRVAFAKIAIAEHQADVLVLDDGFQHRRIARNLNVVLVDATCPFGYGHLLPRGLLREPVSSLRRADVVLITRANQCDAETIEHITQEIRRANDSVPVLEVAFQSQRLRNSTGQSTSFESLASHQVAAFCAIGNPEGFRRTLNDSQLEPAWLQSFPDHHHYSQSDLTQLSERAVDSGIDVLLTTQKDLVKIPADSLNRVPLWAIEIAAEFGDDQSQFESILDRCIADYTTSNSKI